jgi:hypothetical protein
MNVIEMPSCLHKQLNVSMLLSFRFSNTLKIIKLKIQRKDLKELVKIEDSF